MPQVGFGPTISAFKQVKTVHALDRAAAVMGEKKSIYENIIPKSNWVVKVKLSLCSINHLPHQEDVWGSGGIVPAFLTSVIDGGECSA
jgi:hypothetical protein